MKVKKQSHNWLILVASYVTKNLAFKECVENIYPISIQGRTLEVEVIFKSRRCYMLIWLNEEGFPIRVRYVSEQNDFVDVEIFSSEDEGIGT